MATKLTLVSFKHEKRKVFKSEIVHSRTAHISIRDTACFHSVNYDQMWVKLRIPSHEVYYCEAAMARFRVTIENEDFWNLIPHRCWFPSYSATRRNRSALCVAVSRDWVFEVNSFVLIEKWGMRISKSFLKIDAFLCIVLKKKKTFFEVFLCVSVSVFFFFFFFFFLVFNEK